MRDDIRELTSPNLTNQVTLDTLRETLAADRKLITRHPILKHLFLRYEAIVNDTTEFGYPRARIEPTPVLYERLNQLTVETLDKDAIRKRRRRNKASAQQRINASKAKGRAKFERTNGTH